MQAKTIGIILHSVKHSDKATIITVYTQYFGRASYMVFGVNKKKSIVRSSFLQPLTIVEMDVVHSPGKDIQHIKDIRIAHPFNGIPFDPVKNSLALFLSEMLFRVLRHTEPDEQLFLFLENSIQQLDNCEAGIANFHLIFLLKLTRYLGFEPNLDNVHKKYFDLMNGIFLAEKPLHVHFLIPEISEKLYEFLLSDFSNMYELSLSRFVRNQLLDSIIDYYRLHVADFHGLHSIAVLQSLFE